MTKHPPPRETTQAQPRACNRCTGHCCKAFTLALSPAQLVARRDAALQWQARGHESALTRETLQIADMVRFLGYYPPGADFVQGDPSASEFWYTCRNLGPDENCTIYQKRPQMCRNYPNQPPCGYVACTWDEHKMPHGPEHERRLLAGQRIKRTLARRAT